jgi:hypothetical protein
MANNHISFVSLLNISNCIWDHQRINIFLKGNYYILHSPVIPLLLSCIGFLVKKGKGKSVPLQAWSGPEGSRTLRFPDFMTTAQDGGKVVSLTHRPPLPQEIHLYSFLLKVDSTPGP